MPAPLSSPASRPIAIKIIAVAVVLEALALLAGAALYGYGLATQTPISLAGSLFLLVLMVAFGIGCWWSAIFYSAATAGPGPRPWCGRCSLWSWPSR